VAGAHLRAVFEAPAVEGTVMDDRALAAFLDECMRGSQGYFNDGAPGPFQTVDSGPAAAEQSTAVVFYRAALKDLSTVMKFRRSCGANVAAAFCALLRDARIHVAHESRLIGQHDVPGPRLHHVDGTWLLYGVPARGPVVVARVMHLASYWESDLFGGVSFGDDE